MKLSFEVEFSVIRLTHTSSCGILSSFLTKEGHKMILEFIVENFRSIDEEQVLSFYTKGTQGGNLGNTVVLPDTPYRILKSIGLYGSNASGKTNILRALWTLRRMVCASYRFGEDEHIRWYDPCIFDTARRDGATRFEIDLTIPMEDGLRRFLYTVAYNQTEVIEESLTTFTKNRPARLFSRKRGDTRETIALGASLRGGDRKIAFFKNQSYLSVAGRNAGAPLIMRKVYQYFRTQFTQIRLNEEDWDFSSNEDVDAARLIRFVDVGVTDVKQRIVDDAAIEVRLPPDMPIALRQRLLNRVKNRYVFTHEANRGEFGELDLREESDGTRRMFGLFPQVVDVLTRGGVFIIDEIECGMHPFMAETLVRLFNDSEANVGQAQLLFTTHNSNLMSPNLLRRDQIWFTEKKCGRTRCYSLDDFDKKMVTPTSPYVKWYLEGRFGAIPSIDFAGLVEAVIALRERR